MITTEGPAPVALILALVFGLSCLGWAASFEMVGRSEGRSGARRLLWRIAAAFAGALTLWTLPLVCVARLSSSVGWSGSGLFAGLAILVLACSLGLRPPGVGRRSAGYVSVMAVGLLSAPLIEIAALRAPASIDLRAGWIGPAAITALVASWLAASHRQPPRVRRGPLAAGAATTAMVALVSSGAARGAQPIQVDPAGTAWLAASAVLATVLVTGFGLLAALFDRQLALTAARATEAIKSHEARLSQVLEHLPFGVMVADAATGALLFANREANRVRGALRTTSSGSDGFVPTGDPLGDPLLRALRDEETISRELQTCRAAENRSVTLEISAFPLYDENRQLVRAIAAFQDVSARVQAEADLRQAQKIDALGQLTGGIAHDTNNLLTAILGNLDLLEPRLTDDHQRTLLRNALSATERGAKLTSQLLGFSRRQALAAGPVDVNRAVEAMSPLLCSTLGGTIQIESDLAPDLWTAYADPTQLELVLLNLSINARDAMPDGGAIRISTANRVLLATECATDPGPGEYVVLSVSDGGTGMTAATLSRAFEPFFTTKGPGHGSGLGLSQVLGIAQQLGGGVRIASEVGLGTTVSLLMPRSLAEIAPAPSNASPSHGAAMLRGKTILLVDDDNDVRTAARALLAQFGCIVIEETNGRAAVARIASPERIDLVIIDFAMPGLTGADAGERMLAIRPGLPILVITGYADADELPGVGGRFPSLQKPFRGAQLAETLSSLVADSSPHAPTDVADHNQAASVLSFPRPRPRPREAESPIMPFSRRDIG